MDKYLTSETLPSDWEDNIGNNPYLKKSFLKLIEQIDSSEKSYYVFRNAEGKIDTQFLISKTSDNDLSLIHISEPTRP